MVARVVWDDEVAGSNPVSPTSISAYQYGDSMPENEPIHEQPEEIVERGGKKFRRVNSGYTIRQYFSHSTPEKGPGPGWDMHQYKLDEYDVNSTSQLPDEPYYYLEEIIDEDEEDE